MTSTSKYKRLRRRVHAKRALAELEAVGNITMRSDAIEARNIAADELEEFIDSGNVAHLENALDMVESGVEGAYGDADVFFKHAMDELTTAVAYDN